MSNYAILIDSEHAKVFSFDAGEVTHHVYHRHEPQHHTGHTQDQEKKSENLFHQVAEHLQGAEHLLLMGSGQRRAWRTSTDSVSTQASTTSPSL